MVAVLIPEFPKISIGEGFMPQVDATVLAIDRVSAALQNCKEPLETSVDTVMIPSIATNFDTEGRPAWAGLSQSRIYQRKAAHPILNDTGALRALATSRGVWTITNEEAFISGMDAVPYAAFNQLGTSRMPAREFISIQPQDMVAIEEIFSVWVDAKIRESGFNG